MSDIWDKPSIETLKNYPRSNRKFSYFDNRIISSFIDPKTVDKSNMSRKNNNIKYIKKVIDAYQYNYNEFRKYKEQIINNNKPWIFYNVRIDFCNRLVKNSDGYFEIPIFDKLDVKDIEWILSHEVSDIIRIMIENKLKILENGTISLYETF
jgi:hypothetical protein